VRFLRQSTASQEILLGPFVAAADGSAQTGLTIANTDIKLLYAGGTSETNKNSGGGTHIAGGRYSAVLDATDTGTVGILEVSVNASAGIPWNKSYYVLEEAIYDALFAASANAFTGAAGSTFARADLINIAGSAVSTTTAQLGVNIVQISTDSTAADNLETAFDDTAGAVRWMQITDQGTAQAATGTTLQLRAAAAFADDELIGQTVFITGGSTGVGQSRLITGYVSATDTATVDTWTTTPTGTITYKICPTAPSSGGAGATAAEIADAVWDEATAGHTTSGTFGEQCKTDIDAILVDTGTTLDGAIADLPTNAELATALGTADDAVLTAIAGVQSDTNDIQTRLPAALNNGCIPADVQRINDTNVVGVGTEGDKWRA
jgi:hypothetical protein